MGGAIVSLYDCDDCKFRYDAQNFSGVDLGAQPADFDCPRCESG